MHALVTLCCILSWIHAALAFDQRGSMDVFTCPTSNLIPKPRPGYKATSNGCGPEGMTLQSEFEFTPCCDVHDICYGTCQSLRTKCDSAFKLCLHQACGSLTGEKKKECKSQADVYYMTTTLFGGSFFASSQREACVCVDSEGREVKDEL
jgi:secretory phospholipase A2